MPEGFQTAVYLKWEAEHVVPAENFGRTFPEWRESNPFCVDSKDKAFKGRNCTEKANKEYRLMLSELYNFAPAIGSVNAARLNYNFTMLPSAKSQFDSYEMRIEDCKIQPPEESRGRIARTYLYFEAVYPRYRMSSAQRQLMNAWDKQNPATKNECEIASKVKAVQHNDNPVLSARCSVF